MGVEKETNYQRIRKMSKISQISQTWDGTDRRITQLGYFGWRPSFLEVFNNPIAFVTTFGLGNLFMVMAFGTFSIIIPTLETVFNLNSKQTGLILMGNDISGTIAALVIANYCSARKTRWIGLGMLLVTFSALLPSAVHLVTEYPQPADSINITSSKLMVEEHFGMCEVDRQYDTGGTENTKQTELYAIRNHRYYLVFVLASILQGIGAAPPGIAGSTYMDEIFTQKQFGMAISILYIVSFIGYPISIILGGVFLRIYATLDAPEGVTLRSPEWVGAWWMGIFIPSLIVFFISFITLLFPRQMPAAKRILKYKIMNGITSVTEKREELGRNLKQITLETIPACKRLFQNKALAFLIIGDVCLFLQIGTYSFIPKFYSMIFRVKPQDVATILGISNIVGFAVGLFFGGWFIAHRNWKPRQLQLFSAIVSLISSPFILVMLMYCPVNTYAGVDVPYHPVGNLTSSQLYPDIDSSMSLIDNCNTDCGCTTAFYQPVCDGDITYFSPCHAGCRDVITDDSVVTQYTDCRCTASTTARPGDCGGQCNSKLYLSLVLQTIGNGIKFSGFAAHAVVYQRIVSETDRTIAQGFRQSMTRILGTLPAPLLVGLLFDMTCKVWRIDDTGAQGNCWIYDIDKLQGYSVAVQFALALLGALCAFLCWWYYPQSPDVDPSIRESDIDVDVDLGIPVGLDMEKMNGQDQEQIC